MGLLGSPPFRGTDPAPPGVPPSRPSTRRQIEAYHTVPADYGQPRRRGPRSRSGPGRTGPGGGHDPRPFVGRPGPDTSSCPCRAAPPAGRPGRACRPADNREADVGRAPTGGVRRHRRGVAGEGRIAAPCFGSYTEPLPVGPLVGRRPRKTGPKPGKNPPKRGDFARFWPASSSVHDVTIALVRSREGVRTRKLDFLRKILKPRLIMACYENWPGFRHRCISLIANLVHPD
jgi:hypothetical protein